MNNQKYTDFKLLIVDDNQNNLFTLRTLINTCMKTVIIEAASGQEAIDIALKTPDIDLIILDIQMPEMDGFQTASMLKIRQRTKNIPIIFLTAAFKTDEFQKQGYAVGAVDYLCKPIDDNQLINKICTYFKLIEKERNLNRELEIKVAERTEQLRHNNQYLTGVIKNIGEALLILEPTGIIKSVNPATCRMLDYNKETLIGMPIGDVFEESDQEQADAFMGTWLEALIRTGSLSKIDARFITSDNRRIPIQFSRTAMTDAAGNITDILCIAKNMSGYTDLTEKVENQ
ncbi:MAG: response regulator [Gammaproteobacteria bacterium]